MGFGDFKPHWPNARFQPEDCVQISFKNHQNWFTMVWGAAGN